MVAVLVWHESVIPTFGGNMYNLSGNSVFQCPACWHKCYYSVMAYIDFAYLKIQYLYI